MEERKRSGEKVQQDSEVEGRGGLSEVTGEQARKAEEAKEARRRMRSGAERTTYFHQAAPETTSSFIIKDSWDGDTRVDVDAPHKRRFHT